MRFLVVILVISGCLVACAIAIGDRSFAHVGTKVERQVAASAPVIEEVILETVKDK